MADEMISHSDQKDAVIDAALLHVPFDGWSDETLRRALGDSGLDPALGRVMFPRGAVDLALAFHMRGDRKLAEWIASDPFQGMGMTGKITACVRHRIELVQGHREAVRRGTTLFALPIYAADGAKAIWNTADTIWAGLGDSSTDHNWYTKRATLSGVYSATVLYWLGDESDGDEATWAFLDRRIANVMQIEKVKAQMRGNPLGRAFAAGPGRLLELVKAPGAARPMPGRWGR
ncbi:COQ9 family protein [Pontivivens insulae]|uniref:COQ9 C-terminal domain-containing protein n=1 Tax=Pontivivens insulae TaxID=1639689 RepID=A0A2R8A854_9RHOB|nr:COQ9 family protein [Pontivivens insulae]RED18310.1 ubiquinone biosynthesis protein COQ9 [Pontivivens insulae]SPF28208.1 hypothetical protein POI8812_00506 [Pontivivens insulae]